MPGVLESTIEPADTLARRAIWEVDTCTDKLLWVYKHFSSTDFGKECTKTEMRVKRVGEKKMSVVAIICEHYKGTWWRMAFLINVASSIVTNIALVGPWFERPRLRERGTLDGRGGALCVQMDFTQTFEANAKCNNINHVWSHFYKILVVLKYHRRPWANIFDPDIFRSINIEKNSKYTTLM